jgi:hypothetical protein
MCDRGITTGSPRKDEISNLCAKRNPRLPARLSVTRNLARTYGAGKKREWGHLTLLMVFCATDQWWAKLQK